MFMFSVLAMCVSTLCYRRYRYISFQTETESAFVSAVLSASVDPYLMKGLISFLYYYYYYYYRTCAKALLIGFHMKP